MAAFFHFCRVRKWIAENPVLSIKLPEVTPSPTLPFEPDEFEKILAACDEYPTKGIYREGNRARLRAMVLLLRHTGLRIRDGVTLKRDRIVPANSTNEFPRVFLYTQKTGTPVHVPVPQEVVDALATVPIVHGQHIFWSGEGDPKSAVADWQRSFRRLLKIAGVEGHFHMLRDTAAVGWLKGSVPIETVSILLGHKNLKTTLDHYRPWVVALQRKLETEVAASWRTRSSAS